jgi:NTE family protein
MSRFTCVCLNGGGVRGALQVGALNAVSMKHNVTYLHNLFTDGIYGISIGAIIGAFIAYGFGMPEITSISHELNVVELLQQPRLQQLMDFSINKGLDTGDKVHAHLKELFERRKLNLDTLKIGDALAPLYIIATDLTNSKKVVFGKQARLWDALRASISLPLVFTPHVISGRIFVDGAVICKNIIKEVPLKHRDKMLALITTNMSTAGLESASAGTLMSFVLGVQFISKITKMHKMYPENICLLTETETDMLTLEPNIARLLSIGYTLCNTFLSESLD